MNISSFFIYATVHRRHSLLEEIRFSVLSNFLTGVLLTKYTTEVAYSVFSYKSYNVTATSDFAKVHIRRHFKLLTK